MTITTFAPSFVVSPDTYTIFKSSDHFPDSLATITEWDGQIVIIKKDQFAVPSPVQRDWKLCLFEHVEAALQNRLLAMLHQQLASAQELICLEINSRTYLLICLPALELVREILSKTHCVFVMS